MNKIKQIENKRKEGRKVGLYRSVDHWIVQVGHRYLCTHDLHNNVCPTCKGCKKILDSKGQNL